MAKTATMTNTSRMSDATHEESGPLDIRFEMRLDQDLADRLDRQRAKRKMSRAAYTRLALLAQLDQDEEETKSKE